MNTLMNIIKTFVSKDSKDEELKEPSYDLKPLIELSKHENSFTSPYVDRVFAQSGFKEIEIMKIFTDSFQSIQVITQNETHHSREKLQDIYFKNEISDLPPDFQIDHKVEEFPARFLTENVENPNDPLFCNFPSVFATKEQRMVLLTCSKALKNEMFIEPLVCTAYILSDSKIDSEPWNFVPFETAQMYSDVHESIETNEKAGFNLSSDPSNTTLFILISRIIQVDGGNAVTTYYQKSNDKTLKLAQDSVSSCFPRLKDIYYPIAFTFANVGDIEIIKGGIDLPQPYLLKKMLQPSDIPDLIKKAKEKGLPQIPINLHMSAYFTQHQQPEVVSKDGYSYIRPLNDDANQPLMIFRNQLRVTIQGIVLKLPPKIKGRNIVCKISMTNGKLTPGTIANARNGKSDQPSAISICYYHETKPVLNDTFLIELPPVLDPSASIRIELFHAIAQKATEPWSPIGWCELQLANKDGAFIAEGTHDLDVVYDGISIRPPIEQNHVTVEVASKSLLFPPDATIQQFITSGGQVPLDGVKPELLLRYFVIILDAIFKNISNNTDACIKQLFSVCKLIAPIYSELAAFLNYYAIEFAPAADIDAQKVLSGFGVYFEDSNIERTDTRVDVAIVDAVFLAIEKSVLIGRRENVDNILANFCEKMATYCRRTVKIGLNASFSLIDSLARFLVTLSTIGMMSQVCDAIKRAVDIFLVNDNDDKDIHTIAARFLDCVWWPRFYQSDSETPHIFLAMLKEQKTVDTVIQIIQFATAKKESLPIQSIFATFLGIISNYDLSERIWVAAKLSDCLSSLIPATELPFAKSSDSFYAMIFLVFLLSHIDESAFSEWFEKLGRKQDLFDTLHYLIDNAKLSKKFGDLNSGTANKLTNLAKLQKLYQSPTVSQSQSGTRGFKRIKRGMTTHSAEFKPSQIVRTQSQEELSKVVEVSEQTFESNPDVSKKVEENAHQTEQARRIIAACHFAVIRSVDLLVVRIGVRYIADLTLCLYHLLCTDIAIQALPRMIGAINKLVTKRIKDVFEQGFPPLAKFVARIVELTNDFPEAFKIIESIFEADKKQFKSVDRSKCVCIRAIPLIKSGFIAQPNCDKNGEWFCSILHKYFLQPQNETIETRGDYLYERAKLLQHSPDAQFIALQELAEFHHTKEYFAEELQVRVLMLALLAENLTLTKKVKCVWKTDHPCTEFAAICRDYPDIMSLYKGDLSIVGYCDSPFFSIASFIEVATKIITVAIEKGYHEVAIAVSEFAVPLLEAHGLFYAASSIIKKTEAASNTLGTIKPGVDRLLGRYYRVRFFGAAFGEDDGAEYIFREKLLTNVYNLNNRLRDEFTKLFGQCEAIMESGDVDRSKLDPNKNYIQPTSVEPLTNEGPRTRKTAYERGDDLQCFYLDVPFTRGGKAQGTVETQCLRRTIFYPETAMPCATKRVKVQRKEVIEYEPIQVACRQLSERVALLKNAIVSGDNQAVQQLLHGNLMVQVNEGPSRMAEVFLQSERDGEYENKLKDIFREFLKANADGLKLHAKYIASNPIFSMMQHELEAGYDSLSEKLKKYIA